jgi:hypothetical protein
MAINTQKLLPSSKISSPIANFSGFSIQKKTTEVSRITELSKKYNQQNLNIIKSSLIDIDSLLKSVLSENKSTEETKRKRKEREEYEERESRLELPKEQKKFRLPAVSFPGMSFLDRIKRFLFFTALGWLFSNFQSQLPKLLGIVKIITPIYGVVENIFKFILSSVVNFIERGYETYDKIRALVKSVGGENAQKDFDALSSKMNEYINYILIGGMALTGAISAFASNVSKIKPQQPTARPTGGKPRVTTGSGGRPPSTGARVTTSGGKLAQRNLAKNLIRTTVKPALSRLPIVGALIEFGLSWALGDPVGKAAFRGIGSLLVGAVGTAIGGPIGTAIGGLLGGEIGGKVYDQFFGGKKPPAYHKGGRIRAYAKGGSVLGDYGSGRTLEVERTKKPTPRPQSTQPGQDVGGQKEIKKLFPNVNENEKTYNKPNPYYALTGAADDFKSAPYGLGTLMGGEIGGKVYDQFFGGKKPPAYHKGGRIRAYAKGGSVLGDYGSGRTLEVERTKKPTPRPQSTQPGQDVGGQREIKKLFPNVNEKRETYNKPNPYYALTGAADDFKSAPYGLGTLMGGAIDVALGQEMSNTTIINASRGLENMFYDNYDREKNTIDVQSIIQGVVRSAASSAFENIRMQVNKGKKKEEEKKEEPPPGGGAPSGGGGAAPGPAGGSLIDTGLNDYLGRTIKLKGILADAFIDMSSAYKEETGKDLGPAISSSFRTSADNERVRGAAGSLHLTGEAFDINWYRPGGVWIRNNASRFGFRHNTYSGESSHFEWVGGYTPKGKKSKQQTPVSPSTPGTVTQSPSGGGGDAKLLSFISKGEGGYNSMNQGTRGDRIVGSTHNASSILGKNLTDMTVGQIMELQSSGKLFAAGRYQIIPDTMKLAVSRSGVSRDDKFGPSIQDKLGLALIYNGQRPRLSAYLQGKSNDLRGAMEDLALEWASVPHPDTGRSAHPPANISSHSVDEVKRALQSARKAQKGGIASNISSDGNYVLPKQSPTDTSPLEQYTSYSGSGSGKSGIKVQRVVIEKMIPIPMGAKSKSNFMVAGGVNSPDMSAFQS